MSRVVVTCGADGRRRVRWQDRDGVQWSQTLVDDPRSTSELLRVEAPPAEPTVVVVLVEADR